MSYGEAMKIGDGDCLLSIRKKEPKWWLMPLTSATLEDDMRQ